MCHDSSLDGRGLLSLCHTEPNLQRNMLYLGMLSGGIKLWTNSWSRLPIFNVRPVSERGVNLPMAAWSVLTNCRPASRMSANPKPRPKHASPQATSLGHSTKDMYTAEASAMAESRHRARASGSAAMSPFSSFAMRGEHMNVWQVSASTIQTGNGRFVRACRSRKHTWRTSAIPIPSTKTGQTGSGPASAIVASGSFGFHSPWTAPSFGVPVIPGQIGFSE